MQMVLAHHVRHARLRARGEPWVPNTFGAVFARTLREAHVPHVRAKVKWAASTPKRRKKCVVPLSARTVCHIYETLNVALNRAKRQRRIILNPCELLDPPRVEQKEMLALDSAGGGATQSVRG